MKLRLVLIIFIFKFKYNTNIIIVYKIFFFGVRPYKVGYSVCHIFLIHPCYKSLSTVSSIECDPYTQFVRLYKLSV